jgi:hypothetical protein
LDSCINSTVDRNIIRLIIEYFQHQSNLSLTGAVFYLGFDGIPFKFSLICDQVVILQASSGLGCGGSSWEFGPDPVNVASFDLTDDSVIVLDFSDNNKSACGGGPGAYQMTLTKL